jgi:hypothetical protein
VTKRRRKPAPDAAAAAITAARMGRPRQDGMPMHWPFPEPRIVEYWARHRIGEPPKGVG